jgi:hypothetical protein
MQSTKSLDQNESARPDLTKLIESNRIKSNQIESISSRPSIHFDDSILGSGPPREFFTFWRLDFMLGWLDSLACCCRSAGGRAGPSLLLVLG